MRRLFRPHPIYGYTFVPNLKARVPHEGGGYLIRTNARGFRSNHEFRARKPEGTIRVLLFGDSYTAADGVRNEERYSDVVETMLPGLQVLNFGMPGTGTDQQYLIFRDETVGFDYDLVVIAVLVENIRRIVVRYRPYQDDAGTTVYFAKPYFTLQPDGSLRLGGTPVPPEPLTFEQLPVDERALVDRWGRFPALRKLANALGARELLRNVTRYQQKVTRYQPVAEYDDPHDPAWRLMKAILTRWLSETRSPVLLFPLPLYHHVEETASAEGYRARLAELEDPPHVHVHDPLPGLQRRDEATRRSFRFLHDVHPTPAMHRALAEALACGIRLYLPVESTGAITGA